MPEGSPQHHDTYDTTSKPQYSAPFKPIPFLLVVALTAVMCFNGLGTRALWIDEGETAALAQNVLREGFPKALSDTNLVLQSFVSYDKHYRWTYHPWGQFYLAAAGLKLFGHTEFAARLPFALCGVLTVALLYVFVWRHWNNSAIATLAALLLATSATFLLHARQCRYYALSALTCLAVVMVFIELIKHPSRRWWLVWGLALTAQFYADFGTLLAMLPALMFALWWPMRARKKELLAVAAGLAFAILLIIPGLVLHWDRLTTSSGSPAFLSMLLVHLCYIDGWFIPLLLFVPASAVFAWRLLRAKEQLTEQNRIVITCAFVMGSATVAMAWAAPNEHIRYLIPQMGLAKLLLAVILMRTYTALRRRRLTALPAKTALVIAVPILAFTNIASLPMQYIVDLPDYKTPDFRSKSKPFIRMELAGLLYEQTHDFVCPNRVTKNVVNDLAEAGETVVVNCGHLPLVFYRPDLRIRGGMAGVDMLAELQNPPDLIIEHPYITPEFTRYLQDMLGRDDYLSVTIPVPATLFGNLPEPRDHYFAAPSERSAFSVYLRRDHKTRMSKLPLTLEALKTRWYRRR